MFSKEAITELAKAQAITAAQEATTEAIGDYNGNPVALPEDFSLHDTEAYAPTRRRARGQMHTSVLTDFGAYTEAHGQRGATVFVNPDSMAATAVLNLGSPDQPGHADNLATLTLKRTAAYTALLAKAQGQGLKQADVAEFLEDWAGQVKCFSDTEEMAPPKAVAAIRRITIEALRKHESSEQQLSATRSAFENVQATSGGDPLPSHIYFTCEPYMGLQQRTFVLRLAVLTTDDKPKVSLRIVKAEQHQEEMAEELAQLVRDELASKNMPVHLGTYKAST